MQTDQEQDRDYSPEALKQREQKAARMDDDGAEPLSPAETAAFDQIQAGLEDNGSDQKAEAENNPQEMDRNDDDGDDSAPTIPYRNEGGKVSIRKRIVTRRNGIIVSVVAASGIGGFALFGISGPLQLVQLSKFLERIHFSDNNEFNNDRSARRMYNLVRGEGQNNRLGIINNQLADRLELKLNDNGLKSVYGPNKRFIGYEIIDPNKASSILGDFERDGFNITDRDGKPFLDLQNFNFRERRKAIRALVKANGVDGITGKLGSRLLIRRGGVDLHPLKNISRRAGDKIVQFNADRKKERNERNRRGIREDLARSPRADEGTDTDGDGDIDVPPDPEAADAEKAATEILGDADIDIDSPEATKQLKGKLLTKIGGSAVALVGIACILKDLGSGAEQLQYTQTILPMIRTAMMFMAVGSQIQSGEEVNMDEVGSFIADLHDDGDDTTKPSSLWASKPIQAANGQPQTGAEIAEHLRPGKLGEKPAFFAMIDSIPFLDEACDVSGWFSDLPVIKQIGDASMELVAQVIPIDDFINGIVGWLAGKGMDYAATGGPLGAILMYGSRLAANNVWAAMGGIALTLAEELELGFYNREMVNYEFSKRPLFARIFDVTDSRSLAGHFTMNMPRTPHAALSSLMQLPFNAFASFTPRAMAAESYDYGFNAVGFSVDDMNNPLIADPYENAEVVEKNLDELNSKYGLKCFNLTVELSGSQGIQIVNGDQSYRPSDDENKEALSDCNTSDDPMLLRYRAYLADVVGTKSETCYEGVDEAACTELGFGASVQQPGSSAPQPILAPGLNGYTIPCGGQPTTVVRKTPGSPSADWSAIKDSGVIGTNSAGQPIKVYVREACNQANVKTIVVVSSIHGSENGGQLVSHELLFNADLPANVRIVAIPEVNGAGIPSSQRKNANGVDLNRNNDFLWNTLNDADEVRPTGKNYKGTSPGSEPETKAVNSFLSSLGRVNLALYYHDNLDYVAAVGSTPGVFATRYGEAMGMSVGNGFGTHVTQRGSIDAWHNKTTGSPALLVEMSSNQAQTIIDKHVSAVQALLSGVPIQI